MVGADLFIPYESFSFTIFVVELSASIFFKLP